MKRRIKNVLSAMGSGLQHSHAGEMLTNGQKSKVLKSSVVGEILPDKEEAKVLERYA